MSLDHERLTKNHRTTLFGSLIIVLAGVGVMASLQSTKSQQPVKKDNDQRDVTEAIRRGGFREAARLKGHFVTQVDPSWDLATFDLETLTKASSAVVIGQANEGKARLNRGGDVLTTEYDIVITESLKGNFRQANTIQVAMLGGRIDFEDGTSAEVQTPGFEKMVKNKKYLLFLTINRNGSPVLLLTGGPQGLFEIDGSQIKAFARSTDSVSQQVTNKPADDVIRQIQEYALKWPDTQGCCR